MRFNSIHTNGLGNQLEVIMQYNASIQVSMIQTGFSCKINFWRLFGKFEHRKYILLAIYCGYIQTLFVSIVACMVLPVAMQCSMEVAVAICFTF